MAACSVPFTHCQPSCLYEPFDRYQFLRRAKPVSTSRREADGTEINDNRLGFDDVARGIHVEVHVLGRRRRLDTPSYANNDAALRKLLVFHYQRRCGIRSPVITDDLAEQKRLLAMCDDLECKSIRPGLTRKLDQLCRRFVNTKDGNDRERLRVQIQNLDTRLEISNAGPGWLLRVVYGFYRRRLSSPELAQELHCKSVLIRQCLHRLSVSWSVMNGETFVPHHWRPRSESERTVNRLEAQRAANRSLKLR